MSKASALRELFASETTKLVPKQRILYIKRFIIRKMIDNELWFVVNIVK